MGRVWKTWGMLRNRFTRTEYRGLKSVGGLLRVEKGKKMWIRLAETKKKSLILS